MSLSVRIAVNPGRLGVLCLLVSFVSCIVTMSAFTFLARILSSSILFLMPFMLICMIFRLVEGLLEDCVCVV